MWGDRYAVLASGSGTNLRALIESGGEKPSLLVTDRECGAEAIAETAGIRVIRVDQSGNRELMTERILEAAEGVGLLVLAGFMRILAPAAPAAFPDRIVNIHPSLLPAFPGKDAVAQALSAGVKVSGVTVHLVDELVDHGPIIAQRAVPVEEDDTVDSLHRRIQSEEHDLYPQVVNALLADEIKVVEGRVVWS